MKYEFTGLFGMVKKSLYIGFVFLEGFLIGAPAYAQSMQERNEAYDRCQVDVLVCQQAAEHGDTQAQYNLGKMYYTGEGLPQNIQMAKMLWERASKSGDASSLNGLGVIYYTEKNIKHESVEIAKKLFLQAARKGEYRAVININSMLKNKNADIQDLKEADDGFSRFHENNKKMLEQLSNDGNADASYKLSLIYEGDEIQKYDREKQMYYLEKAAKEGNPYAQYDIGYIYLRGSNGLKRDREKAFNYLIEADRQGNRDAPYSLYEYTNNTNEGKALKYLKKAAERRNFKAIRDISYYYLNGEEPYLNKDFKKAFNYFETLSTTLTNKAIYYLGNDYQLVAKYQLAIMYVNGQGVNKSKEKAIDLFKASCDNGYKKSCDELSHLK